MRIAFTNVGAHGHVNPTLAVSQELVARGHEVFYLAPEPFRASIEATGTRFLPYESLFESTARVRSKDGFDVTELPLRLAEDCAHSLPQLLDRLSSLSPDLVVYDALCHGGRLAARRLGLPSARLCPVLPSSELWNVSKALGLAPPLADKALREKVLEKVQPVLSRHGLSDLAPAQIFDFRARLNIVQLAREFHPMPDAFDETFRFVGPCLRDRGEGARGDDLLISLGTVFHDWPEFYETCFAALGGEKRTVRLSTGKPLHFESAPSHFEISPHLDQREALARSAAFVTHGGINSLMEAAYHGVPVVMIPQMPEQLVNARRASELGMGVVIEPAALDPEGLRAAVEKVLQDDSFRKAAIRLGELGRAAGGAAKAADLLVALPP